MQYDQNNKYGGVAQFFHWVMAALIIYTIAIALIAENLPEGEELKQAIALHKSIGMVLLLLIVCRVGWRFYKGSLPPRPELSERVKKLSQLGHQSLYVLMVFMPLSGWLMASSGGHSIVPFGLFELPAIVPENEVVHKIFKIAHQGVASKLLILLIAVHIIAAIKHQFFEKVDLFSRILPFKK